ncbi:MarR family winged helix-turn-helix transcriptional regulator [Clostridium sp. SYSU_GA19001]|uniref:MarR family winged helix-turn-helix transcriptional regulator n=1 Tax=Clostridium caldaquaticum TaxID=2940653 RepID=UPI0020771DE0|nr:MarR family winged helix-turn-helix transcriptional regulator [Clostridium caldaquaticum]MCM8711776.1 MarR family winged helix-turn-helix transcriptional regulator [Clostridium caldaquaticum]
MQDSIYNNLYNALQRLNRQMHRHRHRILPPREGIHRGQMHLLFVISQNDGVIQRDLAEIMDMRPSSITEMLVNLEKNSLIIRKQNEKDKRAIHVYLTDEGKAAVNGFIQANDKLSTSFFSCLTKEEAEKMLELVNKINANFNITDDDTIKCYKEKMHHHNHHEHYGWHCHEDSY